ncbi:MAG: PKD domain-containing protein [Labilibaculum sp.]|nr:PKD domain-containing protein [Labilibaculum sp.]MBI9058465.1 PKD domain-containing protein [Labilibaculum sp.]
MKQKINFSTISKALLLILFFNSCDKADEINIKNAHFEASADTIYLDELCTFVAEDTLGGLNYEWDFGDGTLLKGGHTVSHQYTTNGTHTVYLDIDGRQQTTQIKVLPGRISYQIINNSNYWLDNTLIYLDNYEAGCTKRLYGIRPKSKTDHIYATSTFWARNANSHSHIFGISIFVDNSEYTLYDCFFISDFQNHLITITDSTKLIPRMSHGDLKVSTLKELNTF